MFLSTTIHFPPSHIIGARMVIIVTGPSNIVSITLVIRIQPQTAVLARIAVPPPPRARGDLVRGAASVLESVISGVALVGDFEVPGGGGGEEGQKDEGGFHRWWEFGRMMGWSEDVIE